MPKIKIDLIEGVSMSLFSTLYMKYIEAKKKNGVIFDQRSIDIVETIDYDFSKFNPTKNNINSIVLRAKYFDEKVSLFIQKNKNPIIVTLGCGLDTRKYRIKNSEKAIFYEIYFPNVINLRTKLIPPQKNDNYLGQSILDNDWINTLAKKHNNAQFIFIIEGVLMYLHESEVKKIIQNIAEYFPNCEIHFDASNTWLTKNFIFYDNASKTQIKFKWGFDDDKEIEKWSNNIKHIATALLLNQEKIKWGLKGIIMRRIPIFKTAYRMLHYNIN